MIVPCLCAHRHWVAWILSLSSDWLCFTVLSLVHFYLPCPISFWSFGLVRYLCVMLCRQYIVTEAPPSWSFIFDLLIILCHRLHLLVCNFYIYLCVALPSIITILDNIFIAGCILYCISALKVFLCYMSVTGLSLSQSLYLYLFTFVEFG